MTRRLWVVYIVDWYPKNYRHGAPLLFPPSLRPLFLLAPSFPYFLSHGLAPSVGASMHRRASVFWLQDWLRSDWFEITEFLSNFLTATVISILPFVLSNVRHPKLPVCLSLPNRQLISIPLVLAASWWPPALLWFAFLIVRRRPGRLEPSDCLAGFYTFVIFATFAVGTGLLSWWPTRSRRAFLSIEARPLWMSRCVCLWRNVFAVILILSIDLMVNRGQSTLVVDANSPNSSRLICFLFFSLSLFHPFPSLHFRPFGSDNLIITNDDRSNNIINKLHGLTRRPTRWLPSAPTFQSKMNTNPAKL